MNAVLTALLNASILSMPLICTVWLVLRLLPRSHITAAARYIAWWLVLSIVMVLPALYLPAPPGTISPSASLQRQDPIGPTQISLHKTHRAHTPLEIPSGPWTTWVMLAWFVTALAMLTRLVASAIELLRRKAGGRPIPMPIRLCRGARLLVSDQAASPIAAGFLKPAILIPTRLVDQLGPEELRQVMLHESAHLARYDDWTLMVQRAIEAVFALHPAVRFIARQLDLEREIACDDRVIQTTGQAKPYAVCLTRVAELAGAASFGALAFSQPSSQLSRRIDMLLDKSRHTAVSLLKTRLALTTGIAGALLWIIVKTPVLFALAPPPVPARPSAPAPQPEPQPALPQPVLIAQAAPPAPPTPAPQTPTPPPPAPTTNDRVVVPVEVVTEDGKFVSGLTADNFRVFEDNVEQTNNQLTLEPSAAQYILTYEPKNQQHDGKYRRIRVQLVRMQGLPPTTVRWRTGYYSARPAN